MLECSRGFADAATIVIIVGRGPAERSTNSLRLSDGQSRRLGSAANKPTRLIWNLMSEWLGSRVSVCASSISLAIAMTIESVKGGRFAMRLSSLFR